MTLEPPLLSLLSLSLPMVLLLAAIPWPPSHRWTIALRLNGLAVAIALIDVVALNISSGPVAAAGLTSPMIFGHLIALLVAFLGFVIVSYSRNHLRGEPGRDAYLSTLQFTLAAVSVVVLCDHLLVLLAGWVAISLGLHRLLLFYPNRPRAALAAHKKFLLARLAELALLLAVLLLYRDFGTWSISEILSAHAHSGARPGEGTQIAMVLLAAVALIKCAQLPVHGWLIQVVEAPTPVSALLHAGIINLGGFLLILFSPLLASVPAARWLVLAVAGLTTVLAALVMTAQVSVKVRLAWSTTAQMGLMLVECALGLPELALLHLLAHACYKAYAFLAAGTAVEQHVLRTLAAPAGRVAARAWLAAVLVAAPAVALAAWLFANGGPLSPWLLLAALIIFVLTQSGSTGKAAPLGIGAAMAVALLVAFVAQKVAVAGLVPDMGHVPTPLGDLWIALLVVGMSAVFWLLRERPDSAFARRLTVALFAGFHLDAWLTRTTLWLWPLRFPPRAQRKQLVDLTREVS